MKELIDIVRAFEEARRKGVHTALATVVGVSGSTYRRPGARMLFAESGRLAGLINAACLESDLSERAGKTIASGKPELISYDTTSPDDIVFGLGLGCNGTVEILMEPSQCPAMGKKIEMLKSCTTGNLPVSLATVVSANGGTGVQMGDYVGRDALGTVNASIKESSIVNPVLTDLKELTEHSFQQKTIRHAKGDIRLFLETLSPPLPILVFGAGPDAVPLVGAAKLLGWHVTVIDHRPAYATKDKLPGADAVLLAEPEQVPDRVKMTPRHVAVIMTHNFDKDKKLLRILLESPARYIGLLGPTSKFQTLLQNIEQEGFKPSEGQRKRLHAPVGLDIGAETPEEIAFSVISEIKAVLEGRGGGFLRDRTGPIH